MENGRSSPLLDDSGSIEESSVGGTGGDGTKLTGPEGPRIDDGDSEIDVWDMVEAWSSSGSPTGAGKAGEIVERVWGAANNGIE
jgi:hypothetical protein